MELGARTAIVAPDDQTPLGDTDQHSDLLAKYGIDVQEILGRLCAIDFFFARDRLREQHVARAVAQLLDHLVVELLDVRELRLR